MAVWYTWIKFDPRVAFFKWNSVQSLKDYPASPTRRAGRHCRRQSDSHTQPGTDVASAAARLELDATRLVDNGNCNDSCVIYRMVVDAVRVGREDRSWLERGGIGDCHNWWTISGVQRLRQQTGTNAVNTRTNWIRFGDNLTRLFLSRVTITKFMVVRFVCLCVSTPWSDWRAMERFKTNGRSFLHTHTHT